MPLSAEQRQLVSDAEIAAIVFDHADGFLLVDLSTDIDDTLAIVRKGGYHFCGVFGIVDGQAVTKSEPTLAAFSVMLAAGLPFAFLAAHRLKQQQPKGDFERFAERLFQLPDHRGQA